MIDFLINFSGALLGWAIWNIAELVIRQKELEEDGDPNTNFHFKEYKQKKMWYWIGSFVCCLLLLWIGERQLSLEPLSEALNHKFNWNDLYYPASGAVFEVFMFLVLWVRKVLKNRIK